MDFFDHPYYKTSKTSARLIGLWPYQGQLERKICNFVTVTLVISQLLGQMGGLINYIDDSAIVLELLMPCMLLIALLIKFVNMCVNVKKIMKLLEQVKLDWDVCTMKEEERILDEYSHMGQLVVNTYTVLLYVAILLVLIEPLMPKWTNYILQSNQTIPNKYPIPIHWYIINMEENFYPIMCFESICIIVTITVSVANDSIFIILLQHVCGLFAVVGHQLENLPMETELKGDRYCDANLLSINDIGYDYYVTCIKNHKRAIEFADVLEKIFVWSFGGIILLNMAIISVMGVQLVTQANTIRETVKIVMNLSLLTFHLFFDCFLSQQLADRSADIQQHISYSKWYGMSMRTKRLVTVVTLRSQVACKLTAGKLITLSMASFGAIIKTSISYFTVILSTQ